MSCKPLELDMPYVRSFHLENVRHFSNRVGINIDGPDPSLSEVSSMLVTEERERGDNDQGSRWPRKQWDPEAQSFSHSTASLEKYVFFAFEQSLRELQLEVTRFFAKPFEGQATERLQRRNGSLPRDPQWHGHRRGKENNWLGYIRNSKLISSTANRPNRAVADLFTDV